MKMCLTTRQIFIIIIILFGFWWWNSIFSWVCIIWIDVEHSFNFLTWYLTSIMKPITETFWSLFSISYLALTEIDFSCNFAAAALTHTYTHTHTILTEYHFLYTCVCETFIIYKKNMEYSHFYRWKALRIE